MVIAIFKRLRQFRFSLRARRNNPLRISRDVIGSDIEWAL